MEVGQLLKFTQGSHISEKVQEIGTGGGICSVHQSFRVWELFCPSILTLGKKNGNDKQDHIWP